MNLTIVEAKDFVKLVDIDELGPMFITALKEHGFKFDLITTPALNLEIRLMSYIGDKEHVVIISPTSDSLDLYSEDISLSARNNSPNLTYICCIIFDINLDKLINLVKRTNNMKAFL